MQNIPLNQLKPAKSNVRQVKANTGKLKELKASMETQGLLHNLVVMKNCEGYEVIDGNRRLAVLRKIHGKDSDRKIPCVIIKDDNGAGLHANMMREDMHPLDQCDVINELCSDGSHDFDSVAAEFGQTLKWVNQRVALAELSPTAKARFRNLDFNIGVAQELTLGSHEQQDEFLARYEQDQRIYPSDARRHMTTNKVPVTAALFNIKGKDDLAIERDLFGDEEYITNIEAFEKYQNLYVNQIVEDYQKKDYKAVRLLVDQYPFEHNDYKKLHRLYGDQQENHVPEDTIVVVIYNSTRFVTDIQYYEDPQDMSSAELEALDNGEEPVLSDKDMSNPQRMMYDNMKAKMIRDWLLDNDKDATLLAMVAATAFHSYTWSGRTRPVDVTFNTRNEFDEKNTPDNYKEHDRYADAQKLAVTVNENYADVDRHTLDYFITDDLNWIVQQLAPIIANSIPTHVLNNEEVQKCIGFETPDGWFKPEKKWLGKYKAAQLHDIWVNSLNQAPLADMSKASYLEAIYNHLQQHPTWDPLAPVVENQAEAAE